MYVFDSVSYFALSCSRHHHLEISQLQGARISAWLVPSPVLPLKILWISKHVCNANFYTQKNTPQIPRAFYLDSIHHSMLKSNPDVLYLQCTLCQFVSKSFPSFVDVNECLSRETFTCHQRVSCVNTNGFYFCVCHSGFTGDGKMICTGDDNLSLLRHKP